MAPNKAGPGGLAGVHQTAEEVTERIFQELDVNLDHRLSQEEFVKGFTDNPQLMGLMRRDGRI